MGRQDNWSMPKQLKIARDGEPKGIKRGKNKDRRKGQKARLDELLAAKKTAEAYRKWTLKSIERAEIYGREDYFTGWGDLFQKARKKIEVLILAAALDGVLKTKEEAEFYRVEGI